MKSGAQTSNNMAENSIVVCNVQLVQANCGCVECSFDGPEFFGEFSTSDSFIWAGKAGIGRLVLGSSGWFVLA